MRSVRLKVLPHVRLTRDFRPPKEAFKWTQSNCKYVIHRAVMHCHLLDASEVYSAMELTEREWKARQPFMNCTGSHEDNLTRMIQHRHAVPGWELSRGQAWLCRSPCCCYSLLLYPNISEQTRVPMALKGSWAKSFGKRCAATAAFVQGGKKTRLD